VRFGGENHNQSQQPGRRPHGLKRNQVLMHSGAGVEGVAREVAEYCEYDCKFNARPRRRWRRTKYTFPKEF
jgi:hypothetical protein